MRKGLVLVGLTAVFGIGIATPAFADTGVSGTVCDTAFPGDCSRFVFVSPPLSGPWLAAADFCNGYPPIPTVTEHCFYVEVDTPVALP